MSATKIENNTNGSLKNGSSNGSVKTHNGSPTPNGGLRRGNSAINASVHEMYVSKLLFFLNSICLCLLNSSILFIND